MKYGLRITRDTLTRAVTVHPVAPVKDDAQEYRLRHPAPHFADSLRIFETKREAEAAAKQERVAADYATKTTEELFDIFNGDARTLLALGYPFVRQFQMLGVNRGTYESYLYKYNPPNPRTTARLHLMRLLLENVHQEIANLLPAKEGCGNPLMHKAYRQKVEQ